MQLRAQKTFEVFLLGGLSSPSTSLARGWPDRPRPLRGPFGIVKSWVGSGDVSRVVYWPGVSGVPIRYSTLSSILGYDEPVDLGSQFGQSNVWVV